MNSINEHTLLIVDDEKNILNALRRIFEEEGYTILTATSGLEALELLEKSSIQVIISDQMMPNMTGAEFFRQVKNLYPKTIRIILSAYSDFDSIKEAINEGSIYKFLNKPWDNNLLCQQVRGAFLVNAEQNEKEQNVIKLINQAKFNETNKASFKSLVSEQEIQDALNHEQFVIYYQPIVGANNNKIIAAEALLRWQHPTLGLLSSDQFIPFCEESGFILPIGAWVLRVACHQLKLWHDQGYNNLSIAVNVSARQFKDSKLLDDIRKALLSSRISPSFLEIEITESLVMSNVETNIVMLQALRNLGIKLSLDDFGTGYSSLSYLKVFPIDILKIDKSFIDDIVSNQSSIEILSAIIALAKILGLATIAEGIEKSEQLQILKEKNCDRIQGYLFSKPVPAEEFSQLLKKGKMVPKNP
jgi:EAL domain-containing protein (putative c-di-GMP-specific phosphodiesterase class I)/FixJ family two-component response regulator